MDCHFEVVSCLTLFNVQKNVSKHAPSMAEAF